MESTNGGGTVICSLCEKEFSKTETSVVYGDQVYELCKACAEEHNKALKKIENDLSKLKVKKLKEWLKQNRAVKRFYRRQLTLSLLKGKVK